MLSQIKKYVPEPIKGALAPVYQRTIGQWQKRRLFLRMQKKHHELLAQLKGKESIRVVFLAIHKSVWKVDPVFQKMLDDPFFEPVILVCPYTAYGEERMWEDMRECILYFNEKGYTTYSTYNAIEQRWIKLDELAPDIVFFTNPHNLTRKEYYEDAYLNYLSCYSGYGIHVANYDGNQGQYNQNFHNALWKIFVQTKEMYQGYANKSQRGEIGLNLVVDSIVEQIISAKREKSVWKNYATHKKVIFAPHHTINKDFSLQLGNFLEYAEFIKDLVVETRESISWSFKPHPMLKEKLYEHNDWGVVRTDAYYEFWTFQSNTQLDTGEYIALFVQSDAMIHDSASFIAEYIFANKPVLYLMNQNTRKNLNSFGNACLDVSSEAWDMQDIRKFIKSLVFDRDEKRKFRDIFIADYFFEVGESTSTTVVSYCLKSSLGVEL